MKLIGIVGGIGSGKSFVSRAFQDLGAKWIDADRLAHEAYSLPEVRQAVQDRWGEQIVSADGRIDRAQVAARVFAPNEQGIQDLEWLEALLHPIVRRQLEQELDRWRDGGVPLVILDAPVLIKAGWHEFCDELVFVAADEVTRWQRVQPRGWTRDQWQRREALQTSLVEKQALATVTVDNDGSAAETQQQIQELWNRWVTTASAAP
jgi:dephospho-CoA kinase